MATINYSSLSPWSNTLQNNLFLELLAIRPVPAEPDDFYYQIESQYTHRPDVLSYDLYGTTKLWWVFVQRNMDVIRDPIFDFVPGAKIFIPKKSNLQQYMSL
jgi:hypothetical protein